MTRRQTHTEGDKHTQRDRIGRQTGTASDMEIEKEGTDTENDRETDRHIQGETDRHRETLTDTERDRKTGRLTELTDRERERERQTDRQAN